MRFHRLAYSAPLRDGEKPQPFKTRDGAAFNELVAPLAKSGNEYGKLIYNFPFTDDRGAALGRECFEFVKPDDLIVLATRPPLDDPEHGDRKRLPQSGSHLERSIFTECRKYLEICARSHVRLSETVGKDCAKADMKFGSNRNGRLVGYSPWRGFPETKTDKEAADKEAYTTMGFFLRLKEIPDYRCGLIASFGMGGLETLIWNRIVRTRYADWINRSTFIMAEMVIPQLPAALMTLDFADEIHPQILVEHVIL